MLDGLKPYPAYKESGVPWLGKVPEHWAVRRAKAVFRCIDVRSTTGGEELLTVSSERGVVPRSSATVTMFKAESYVGHKLCWPGDLVINSLWAWGRGLGVSWHHGLVSSAYGVYRLGPDSGCEPRFIHEFVRSVPFNWELRVRSRGVWISRLQLTDDQFLAAPMPIPSQEEQVSIVRFLEHADREIRRCVRARMKLIKLLEEQKVAIIDQTVRRGLPPSDSLKHSGIDWIGEIPEHWDVARLRSFASRITSGSRGWSNYAADTGPLFIRIGNLTRTSVDLDLEETVRLALPASVLGEASRTRVATGDVLLSITAFIGSVAVVPSKLEEAYVSQHVACCRLSPGAANPRWVAYALLSPIGQTHGVLSMYGGTKQGLSLDDVKDYLVLLPPRAEQDDLVRRIDALVVSIDSGIAAVKREVQLIREFRTRLIADVVTGKFDVREAAAQLPEETSAPDATEYDEVDTPVEDDADNEPDADSVGSEA